MSAWERVVGSCLRPRACSALAALWMGVILPVAASAQFMEPDDLLVPNPHPHAAPSYVIPGPTELSTLYADGSEILVETNEVWRLMCGSDWTGVTSDDLSQIAQRHYVSQAAGPKIPVDTPKRGAGINIIFNADGTVPAEALSALALAEAYLENQFADVISVAVAVSFSDMGSGGVIGATSPVYVSNVAYATSRTGLVSGMDVTDVIQTWLPAGSTVPVWRSGPSGGVTNESTVDWTRANYRATVGTVSGSAASMSFNSNASISWDYDPANGVPVDKLSFVDVVVHETGHALGFISGADNFGGMNFLPLDLYRFQRSTNNPSTYATFQTMTRLVSYNNPTGEDVNTDLITAEYQMEDGSPYQASHFKQEPPYLGIMQPAQYSGESHYPNYFSAADLAAFDAIGYDYPPCTNPYFTQHPSNQTVCLGGQASFTAVAEGAETYRWRRGSTELYDGGNISGATTTTLVIDPVGSGDAAGTYNLLASNVCGSLNSNAASLTVRTLPTITQQPSTHTGRVGQPTTFTVTANGVGTLEYQWRRGGVDLSDVGNISGTQTPTLSINPVAKVDAGTYDVVVTDDCGQLPSSVATLWIAGDTNCDGVISYGDINPFVVALGGQSSYQSQYPSCFWLIADVNGDSSVNYGDINPFVMVLSAP